MFGDVAFAQAPFAALGGATLYSSVDEAAAANASQDQTSQAGALVQEAVSATGAYSVYGTMVATNSEASAAASTTNFAASILVATQLENAAGADIVAKAASSYLATQAETAGAFASPSTVATVLAAVAEAAAGVDAVDGVRVYTVELTEAASGAATQTSTKVTYTTVQELASALETYAVQRTGNVYPAGIQLNVYVGQVLVWGTIPTGQTPPAPDWTDIPT